MKNSITIVAGLLIAQLSIGQSATENIILKSPKKNWQLKDLKENKIQGTATEKAYRELLQGKTAKPVVVAIIDSGVDSEHEDIKDNMWINEDEIPDNGIDDDKNGYIDDVHGWNFIGGADSNVVQDNLEYVRMLHKMKPQFETKDSLLMKERHPEKYKLYKEISAKYQEEKKEAELTIKGLKNLKANFDYCDEYIKKYLKKDSYTIEDVKSIEAHDKQVASIKKFVIGMTKSGLSYEGFLEFYNHMNDQLKYHLNPEINSREIVGDDYANKRERYYGNNDVKGEGAEHGTHVAGIVAATRNNGVGIDGIAAKAQIMSIRAVPNGDERDKDVANAILYAVENGAQIINMSFGKNYSSFPEIVQEAIQKADSAGVLMIHAAGNNSEDNDVITHYPLHEYKDGKKAINWITVGASASRKGKRLPGTFSNYGAKSVDIFAPGVDILSLKPDNQYAINSGTSMASPVVAGVAALVKSYYPNLTATQLKQILLESSVKYPKQKVFLPKTGGKKKKKKVRFGTLSTTGGVVNAYNALQMAETMSKQ